MLMSYKLGQGSIVLRVKLRNSSVTTGAGLTGLTSASSGLVISTIADNEATPTTYTVAGSTIESITTLGTYATPTATKCRFKEVDATNHKGVYEIQIADARFAVANAKSMMVSISGATNLAECDFIIRLTAFDPYDGVRGNLTALPNAAAAASNGLLTAGTGTNQISVASGAVLVQSGTGTGQLSLASGVVASNVTQFGGAAGTFASGRPEVNTTHFGGTILVQSGGIPSVNTVQWRGTQPNTLLSGRVDSSAGALGTAVITNAAFAADAIDSNALAANAVAEIVAGTRAMVVESNGSVTLQQAIDIIYCAVAGVTSGGGLTFKDPTATTTRITYTVDGSNNRTAVSPSPSV
jgi:hypothetical protein